MFSFGKTVSDRFGLLLGCVGMLLCLQEMFGALHKPEMLLREYCLDCHDGETSKGDLDIATALEERPLVRNMDLWINVLERIRNGEMPPKKKPQPTDKQRSALSDWLEASIHRFDYSEIKDPGYEPVRRLTHYEFGNTLTDLFGMEVDVTEDFPVDLSGTSGFDNSANTLFLAPLLLERYLGAVDKVIQAALPREATTKEELQRRALIFIAQEGEGGAARKILSRFLARAWRRNVQPVEVDEIMRHFERSMGKGRNFDESIRKALALVLVSPHFLLKVESAPPDGKDHEIASRELANRLSYFLWASMPDDELVSVSGKLNQKPVLERQVARMMSDSRSDSLGTIFAAQWLGFEDLGVRIRMDPIDNPWCTDSLMDAMKAESAMFFVSLLRENRSIADLIDSDYTYLNEELARHYRIRGIEGEQMRRVALRKEWHRGGIFGQGSLMAVTAFPGRTSPVVRGKWVLADVLGTPPPPPPPDAGELDEEIRRKRKLSLREKLELHREKPSCNGCHSKIDPLGFSLENYDFFGRWRERDSRGRLPDGTEIEGPEDLKKVIVEKRMGELTRQVTRKTLAYALGRQLEYYDEPAVRKIVRALEAEEYRFQTLIREIVLSYPFRYKRLPAEAVGSGTDGGE